LAFKKFSASLNVTFITDLYGCSFFKKWRKDSLSIKILKNFHRTFEVTMYLNNLKKCSRFRGLGFLLVPLCVMFHASLIISINELYHCKGRAHFLFSSTLFIRLTLKSYIYLKVFLLWVYGLIKTFKIDNGRGTSIERPTARSPRRGRRAVYGSGC
jgi:hypothetical protein